MVTAKWLWSPSQSQVPQPAWGMGNKRAICAAVRSLDFGTTMNHQNSDCSYMKYTFEVLQIISLSQIVPPRTLGLLLPGRAEEPCASREWQKATGVGGYPDSTGFLPDFIFVNGGLH